MRGLSLFWDAFKRSPRTAFFKLLRDYLTYAGMVFFCLALWLLRTPLARLDRASRRSWREQLIATIGRISHA